MKKSILFVLFLLLTCYSVFGQITVKGKVVDDTGEFLPGATVQIKGTTKGTVTNMEGNFEIDVESKDDTLVFRFVGFKSIEMKVLEIKEIVALKSPIDFYCDFYDMPLEINYWSGIFYNPYGISFSKIWKFLPITYYLKLEGGYSTNFKLNSDFYGKIGSDIFRQRLFYKFQRTTFIDNDKKNTIATHSLETGHNFGYMVVFGGVGYQKFTKRELENNETKKFGINVGLSKYVRYIGTISAKSFYWFDYWAWEANLNKDFKRKIHTSISYRQTTQDFKEINLTLGYIF